MLELVLVIIGTLFWTYWEAKVDDNHFERGQYFSGHKDRWWNRFSTVLLICIFDPILAAMSGFLFYAAFDIMLNLQRELPWNYVGTESDSDKLIKNKKRFLIKTIVSSLVVVGLIITKILII